MNWEKNDWLKCVAYLKMNKYSNTYVCDIDCVKWQTLVYAIIIIAFVWPREKSNLISISKSLFFPPSTFL